MRTVRTICTTPPGCHNGCGIIALIDDERVMEIRGDPLNPFNSGSLCPRGAALPETVDGDGDMDLFVSGFGSGVIWIENRGSIPVVHYIGAIEVGVKKCFAVDMDGDSLMDVAGIACAEGGAGWWRNPGCTDGEWECNVIDSYLSGPKDIWCRGDSIVIASLFSDAFVSFIPGIQFPEGFSCCCISDEGDIILGHRFGFLIHIRAVILRMMLKQ